LHRQHRRARSRLACPCLAVTMTLADKLAQSQC
jgi:hypothetical protein